MLKELGYDVIIANDGKEALKVFKATLRYFLCDFGYDNAPYGRRAMFSGIKKDQTRY